METLWKYRFEICIACSGALLFVNMLLPDFLNDGINLCMLFLFLMSIILLKLSTINEHIKTKIHQGGNL